MISDMRLTLPLRFVIFAIVAALVTFALVLWRRFGYSGFVVAEQVGDSDA
jgi:hypothetical protein